MARHEHFESLCAAASVGQASGAELAELQEHFSQCPDCQQVYSEILQLGAVRLGQGRLGEVAEAVETMAKEFSRWPSWRAGLALVAAELGRREVAAQHFEELAADSFGQIPRDFAWVAAMAMLTLTCCFLDDARRAEDLYRLLLPFANQNAVLVKI